MSPCLRVNLSLVRAGARHRELEDDILSCQLLVDGTVGVQLVLDRVAVLGVKVHLHILSVSSDTAAYLSSRRSLIESLIAECCASVLRCQLAIYS